MIRARALLSEMSLRFPTLVDCSVLVRISLYAVVLPKPLIWQKLATDIASFFIGSIFTFYFQKNEVEFSCTSNVAGRRTAQAAADDYKANFHTPFS